MPPRQRVSEVQEHAGVALHRSADVAQQHERTRAHAPLPPRQLHHVAAGAEALGDCAPKVDARAAPANPSPCPALSRIPHEARQRLARLRISSAVNAAKSLSATHPDRSRSSGLVSGAGTSLSASPSASVRLIEREDYLDRTCGRRATHPDGASLRTSASWCSRQKASNARSKIAICSWRWTSSARQA